MMRPVKPEDAAAICAIYNYYIESTIISFEETLLQAAEMEERIRKISAKFPYFVWEDDAVGAANGEISGYAYINTWKERSAYRYSAEISIYLKHDLLGRGIGSKLMAGFLEEVRKTEIHTLVAGITIPNEKSVALHEKFGFRKIAHFTEIGRKFDNWIDVGYWELILPPSK